MSRAFAAVAWKSCQSSVHGTRRKLGFLNGVFPLAAGPEITNTWNKKPEFSGRNGNGNPSFPLAAALARIYRRLITFKIFFSIVGVGTGTGTPGSRTSYSLGGSCVTGQFKIKLFPPHALYFKCQAI